MHTLTEVGMGCFYKVRIPEYPDGNSGGIRTLNR